MTDPQLAELFETIEARLDILCQEITIIRESVRPNLAPIIAMHQGKRTAAEEEGNHAQVGQTASTD